MTNLINPFRFNGSLFDPSTLSGIIGWWDFNDETTITRDGSSKIQQINDKSVTAAHLTSPASGNRPGTTTSGGRQWGAFSAATPTCLRTTAAGFTFATGAGFEVYVVYYHSDSGTTARCIVGKGDETTARWAIFANASSTAGQNSGRFRGSGGSVLNILRNIGAHDGLPHFARISRETGGAGACNHEDDKGSGTPGNVNDNINPTEPLWIGGFDNAIGDANFKGFTGQVGEVLIFSAPLGTTDHDNLVNSYLKAKWGIA